MRPLRLVMQAFGPYQGQEVIDFSELGPNRVFLIHGDTGAGKTTLLDAMVFALYGDTSGGERRGEQMRCESAASDLPTEVVFDFGLGEKTFRVRRRPSQWLAAARGGQRLVEKSSEVTLWDRTGCAAGEEGRPLAVKIREVDGVIRALLGFSCDQFRQVVVLPQGRFRELLSAGSDKREEILRQLFRTERFRELEYCLAERAKLVRKQMDHVVLQRQALLEVAGAEDDERLKAASAAAEEAVQAAAACGAECEQAVRAAAEQSRLARSAAEAQKALVEAQARCEALEGEGAVLAAWRESLAAALRAEKVRPLARTEKEASARLVQAREAQGTAETALRAAREQEQQAVERLTAENERLAERQEAAEWVSELRRLTPALASHREAVTERDGSATQAQAARVAHHQANETAAAAQTTCEELRDRAAEAGAAALQLETSRLRLTQAKRIAEQCRRLHEVRESITQAREQQQCLDEGETAAGERSGEAATLALQVEQKWRSGRAAALAAALEEGEPCPVCGAAHHPSPARGKEGAVSDQYLDEARAAAAAACESYDQARQAAVDGRNRLENLLELLEREASLAQGEGAEEGLTPEEASARVSACTTALEECEALAADSGVLADNSAAATRAAEFCKKQVEAAEAELRRAEEALARAETRLQERAAGIPEELVAEGALTEALTAAEIRNKELAEGLARATDAAAATKEQRAACQAQGVSAVAATSAAEVHVQSARSTLAGAIREHGFIDEDDWRGHLLDEAQREELQGEIAVYEEALQLAKGRLQQAQQVAAAQAAAPDPDAAGAALDEATAARETALAAHADAKGLLNRLIKVRSDLQALETQSEEIRATYQTVGMLAEAAGGQNESRVSFQRWVLGVYLDEVLATAGRKLYSMSKGRYRFERQREAQSRRRPAGLDIAVFDEFSGTARPAVTLSGGESFLAALALALGLAETVQEHSAGTPLETIFVDEGFGALDPEALELAVDTLMQLQLSGRLVGVISHVAELRQVIPARLEVRGGSTGSSTRFVVP